MSQLVWLHLSDWHQRGSEFDRRVVRDALIKDIKNRANISPELRHVDFIIFSGDAAWSGMPGEFQGARENLFERVLAVTEQAPERLFMVPGNHDLYLKHVDEMLPEQLKKPFKDSDAVNYWLTDEKRRDRALEPLQSYNDFVNGYTRQNSANYGSITRWEIAGKAVAILGLNSAWMAGRNKDENGNINDYGYIVVGEPQIHDGLAALENADLRIAVMHHPFEWLTEFDRDRVQDRLSRVCHFILQGHVHQIKVNVVQSPSGDCVTIPGGASYDRRLQENQRYINAYNMVHLDFESWHGTVYLRRWSERASSWIADVDVYTNGKYEFPLPKSMPPRDPPPGRIIDPQRTFARKLAILKGYLDALIKANSDLEPGGIKQTKVQVVLPLEEIYIGLQADQDRPDVDRRIMQEELDEVEKQLKKVEDPAAREKQYQIWARQSRPIQDALKLAENREELSSIIQRHRQLVILGDPGSGKTTLVRYLALRYTRALLEAPDRIFQTEDLWDETGVWRLPDLGPVKLPILMRISHYAEARQKEPDLPLMEYLPRYFAGLQVPHAEELGDILSELIENGRALLLLDGLDEIINPADRRNIANAIGQFTNVFRDKGLPESLLAPISKPTERTRGGQDLGKEEFLFTLAPGLDLPEGVRKDLEQRLRLAGPNLPRAQQIALNLLKEARYTHVGNRFIITSRIAGYHFARLPGDFEHYTIRRMNKEDIHRFLERWCLAVEKRLAQNTDTEVVEQRARREIDGIKQALETTPGVRRMAENPLLLRILAIIHRGEAHLPQRRVELYETAAVTLLRDWHLEKGIKDAIIDDVKAMSLLGPLALHIHENWASGLLPRDEAKRVLEGVLSREVREDPESPSLKTKEAVSEFLETVRQHSGLFVERGEGLYGFMHLTFEEYFTARQLISSSAKARQQILSRLHLPRWREPILLAIGALSKQFYDDTRELLEAILEKGSDYESVMHRDLLFAAACVGDSVNVDLTLRKDIATRLLLLFCDRLTTGRYHLLQQQVKGALQTLCSDQGRLAVEAALADILARCTDRRSLGCALEAVDWLKARTLPVAQALEKLAPVGTDTKIFSLLHGVRTQLVGSEFIITAGTEGWNAHLENETLTQFLGLLWRYGWASPLITILGLPEATITQVYQEFMPLDLSGNLKSVQGFIQSWAETPPSQRNVAFWEMLVKEVEEIRSNARSHIPLEEAVKQLISDIVSAVEKDLGLVHLAKHLGRLVSEEEVKNRVQSAPACVSPDEAMERFQRCIGVLEISLTNSAWSEALQKGGMVILKGAISGHTLVPLFVKAAAAFQLGPKPLTDEQVLENMLRPTAFEFTKAATNVLRETSDAEQYFEACLAQMLGSEEGHPEVAAILVSDLAGENTERRRWALCALRQEDFGNLIGVNDERRKLLLDVLNRHPEHAAVVLELLFRDGLNADLLGVCWDILRTPTHPMQREVRELLDGVDILDGEALSLAKIDIGLRNPDLRAPALELLSKVGWQEEPTFKQTVAWMSDKDTEASSLAAIMLAEQGDPYSVPRKVIGKATEEKLRKIQADILASQIPAETRTWSSFKDDPTLVRLLGGLWLQGWEDPIAQLLVGEPAMAFMDKQIGRHRWHFSAHPVSEQAVLDLLLDQAEFGQSLMSILKRAATRLAALEEGQSTASPRVEFLTEVQQGIKDEVEALLARPDTSLIARIEAKSFLATATFNQAAAEAVCDESLRTRLAEAPLAEWYGSVRRLAHNPAMRPTIKAVLDDALLSTNQKMRVLCLSVIADQPVLRVHLTEALAEQLLNRTADCEEMLLVIGTLIQIDPPLSGLYTRLRSMVAPESTEPLTIWARQKLEAKGINVYGPVEELASSIVSDDSDIRLAVALSLLRHDLWLLLLRGLLDAIRSPNDRVRMRATHSIYELARRLPTGASSSAVEALVEFMLMAEDQRLGYEGTVAASALGNVRFSSPELIHRWLACQGDENQFSHRMAKCGLRYVSFVSQEVIKELCAAASDRQRSTKDRKAIFGMLRSIARSNIEFPDWRIISKVFVEGLSDPCLELIRYSAYALQWAAGPTVLDAVPELLKFASSSPDLEGCIWTLLSLGRIFGRASAQRDVSTSPDALFLWLEKKIQERLLYHFINKRLFTDATEFLSKQPITKDADSWDKLISLLLRPEDLGLPRDMARQMRASPEWAKLMEDARVEGELRRLAFSLQQELPRALNQVKGLLNASDPVLRRAAAGALARIYESESNRPAQLCDLLPDDISVLWALVDALATSEGGWSEERASSSKQIADWMASRSVEKCGELVDVLLNELEHQLKLLEFSDKADSGLKETDQVSPHEEGWPFRGAIVSVLADVSDRGTSRMFTRTRSLDSVVSLFTQAASDPQDYNVRRFAIRVLGNLQHFTDQVAEVFFAACQDVADVYHDSRTAVTKFKYFSYETREGPAERARAGLDRLVTAVGNTNVTVSYHAALLLGELGVFRSEELGPAGRKLVSDELVRLLDDPNSERVVYDFSKGKSGERIGPLYDAIYDALVRIVSGPDAPAPVESTP